MNDNYYSLLSDRNFRNELGDSTTIIVWGWFVSLNHNSKSTDDEIEYSISDIEDATDLSDDMILFAIMNLIEKRYLTVRKEGSTRYASLDHAKVDLAKGYVA